MTTEGVNIVVKDIQAVGLKIKQSALEIEFYVFAIDGKTISDQLGVRRMEWHQKRYKTAGRPGCRCS